MKKTLKFLMFSMLCVMILLFGVAAVYASPSQTTDIEKTRLGSSNTYYSFDSAEKVLIISGEGETPDFTNSSGSPTSQPWYKWKNDGSIESVVVEEGITYLGNYIFADCGAKNVSLPDSIKSIGSSAFSGNANITELDLKKTSFVSNGAFSRCFDLVNVNFSSNIEYIGNGAFERCTSLETINFESMTSNLDIAQRAFLSCPNLKKVILPKGANPSGYSLGFDKAQAGYYYDDFVMYIYRDSKAYDYAVKNGIKYELLNTMVMRQGESVTRTYFEHNKSESMVFAFIPENDGHYRFKSSGDLDVACVLTEKNSPDASLAESDDNSQFDLNFTVEYDLKKGTEYYFIVKSNRSVGDFTVELSLGADYGDFNYDGYVNAKDYAVIKKCYGAYESDNLRLKYYDKNSDGIIDDNDWKYAKKSLL